MTYEYAPNARVPGTDAPLVEPPAATVRDRVLRLGGEDVCAAEEVLAQTVVGPRRFVVVRHVFNSLRNPLHLFSALTGHPVQVSRILLVVSAGEAETKVLEITRRKNTLALDSRNRCRRARAVGFAVRATAGRPYNTSNLGRPGTRPPGAGRLPAEQARAASGFPPASTASAARLRSARRASSFPLHRPRRS